MGNGQVAGQVAGSRAGCRLLPGCSGFVYPGWLGWIGLVRLVQLVRLVVDCWSYVPELQIE